MLLVSAGMFKLFFLIISIFFKILSCTLIGKIMLSAAEVKLHATQRSFQDSSIYIGTIFWLASLCAFLSIAPSYSSPFFWCLSAALLFIVIYGIHLILRFVTNLNPVRNYITTTFSITMAMCVYDYLTIYILFGDQMVWKPQLVLISICVFMGVVFSTLQISAMHNYGAAIKVEPKWLLMGVIIAGFAWSVNPFVSMAVTLPPEAFVNHPFHFFSDLTIVLIGMVPMVAMYFMPSYYEQNMIRLHADKLLETKQYYNSLFDSNPNAVFALDMQGQITQVNIQGEILIKLPAHQLIGTSYGQLIAENSLPELNAHFQKVAAGEASTFELSLLIKENNHQIEVMVSVMPIIVRGVQIGVYAICKDISERNKHQRIITEMAYNDELTGLFNRRAFNEQIENSVGRSGGMPVHFSVIFIDLDRFKHINDFYGHKLGDLVIHEAAMRLMKSAPEPCSIARMGGDEFTIYVPGYRSSEELERLAQVIVDEFKLPMEIESQTVQLSVSLGLATYPSDSNNADTLLIYADMAMYEAKSNGGNGFRIFDKSMVNFVPQPPQLILRNET